MKNVKQFGFFLKIREKSLNSGVKCIIIRYPVWRSWTVVWDERLAPVPLQHVVKGDYRQVLRCQTAATEMQTGENKHTSIELVQTKTKRPLLGRDG